MVLDLALLRWIEVRPASSVEYEPGNLSSILEVLYNTRKPFRFVVASTKTEYGRNIIRFYIQVEEDLADRLANLLRSWLSVQVLMDSKPPSTTHELCVEYGLRSHYALPVIDLDRKPEVNNVDGVVAALASEGGIFEVTATADVVSAKRGIYEWIRKKTGSSAGFGDAFLDQAFNAIGAVLGGPYRGGGGAVKQMDPVVKIRIDAASKKVSRSLFNCSVKAYGSMDLAKAVLEALPSSAVNRFTLERAYRGVMLPNDLSPPKKHTLRNFINTISPLFSIAILVCAFLARVIRLSFTEIELFIIALSIIPAALIKIFLPKKKPLILSTDELSMIIGMPSGIGRLPIETALAPPTREVILAEESVAMKKEAVVAEAKRAERRGLAEAEKTLPYQHGHEDSKNHPTDTLH